MSTTSEHDEQVALFRWAALLEPCIPELALLHSVPNGGHRHKATAARLKAEGVKAGVPDVCLPVARQSYHGLYIEMKRIGGRLSEEQRLWRQRLIEQGYRVWLCWSWYDAARVIADYLGVQPADVGL